MKLPAKGLTAVAIAFLLVGLTLTFARGAVIGAGFSVPLLMLKRSLRRQLLFGAALLLIFVVLFWPALQGVLAFRYQALLNPLELGQQTSYIYRANAWRAAVDIIRDYPIWGIGIGQWQEYVPRYGQTQPVYNRGRQQWENGYAQHPHNYYLAVATDAGLLGLLAWASLLALVFREGVYVLRRSKDAAVRNLALGGVAGLAALACALLFEGEIYMGLGMVFWVLVGIISCLGARVRALEAGRDKRQGEIG